MDDDFYPAETIVIVTNVDVNIERGGIHDPLPQSDSTKSIGGSGQQPAIAKPSNFGGQSAGNSDKK